MEEKTNLPLEEKDEKLEESEKTSLEKEDSTKDSEESTLFSKKKIPFKWTKKSFFYSFLWLAPLLIILDQVTKWLVVNFASGTGPIEVIHHFFYINLTFNKGSSFGMGSDVPWMRYVFIVISWVASAAILYYWIKNLGKNDRIIDILLCFCLAGAIGNGIDRTFYWEGTTSFSGVIDFFQFYIFGYGDGKSSFAIFNVADMYLTCAVFVLVIVLLYREIKGAKAKNK